MTAPFTQMTRRALLAALAVAPALAVAQDDADQPLEEYMWVARPVIVFAQTPNDPRLLHQLRELDGAREALEARDVVVLVDTDPGPSRFETTALRTKFRPHDFNVLLIDKDGEVKLRRPNPISGAQLVRMIDRLPLRQQETGRR